MKRFSIIISLTICSLVSQGQIQYLRYNDNFSYLKTDSSSKQILQKIKYIPITRNVMVSFGGEIREQLQYYRNINFGDVPPTYSKSSSGQLWHRAMLHANVEVGEKIRLFTEVGSTYRFFNSNPLTPEIEENQLSLHQAFIDYRFNNRWMIRVGRQEISYGNHRLITFREGPNTRLTFDAAVVKYNTAKRKIDVVALSPIISQKGVFDDKTFKDFIFGVYTTEKLTSKALNLDYYLLNFSSTRRKYNYSSGKENRRVVGARLFSEKPKTNYELEATYQFGKFNGLKIKAYSLSADVNYKLPFKNMFIMGMAVNYISGDKEKEDQQLNTYNLLFSKPQYGLTAPIGATNIITVNPYLKMAPTKRSHIYAGVNFLWRQSNQDGTYSPGGVQLRPKPESLFISPKKEIGTLLMLETSYSLSRHLSLALDASHFFAGRYVNETGKGRGISYLSFKTTFKF